MAIHRGPNAFLVKIGCGPVLTVGYVGIKWLQASFDRGKLLLPLVEIRIFGPNTAKFGPKYACLVIFGQILAYLIIWCHARPIK